LGLKGLVVVVVVVVVRSHMIYPDESWHLFFFSHGVYVD
jgi:hypothetical protein